MWTKDLEVLVKLVLNVLWKNQDLDAEFSTKHTVHNIFLLPAQLSLLRTSSQRLWLQVGYLLGWPRSVLGHRWFATCKQKQPSAEETKRPVPSPFPGTNTPNRAGNGRETCACERHRATCPFACARQVGGIFLLKRKKNSSLPEINGNFNFIYPDQSLIPLLSIPSMRVPNSPLVMRTERHHYVSTKPHTFHPL